MEEGRFSSSQPLSAPRELLQVDLAPELPEIRRLVAAFDSLAGELGIAVAVAFELTLVLEELFTNIVSYGGIGPADGRIRVLFRADGEDLEISVSDPGKPFDPSSTPSPATDTPLPDRAVGGLGIHLVRAMVDDFRYRRVAGRNEVRVRKRIGGAAR